MSPGMLGLNAVTLMGASDQERGTQLQSISENGFSAIRIPIQWPDVEKSRGVFDWSSIDKLVIGAYNSGLNILGLLTYTPSWAASPEGRNFIHPGPSDPADFANFARLATERYRGAIRNWEIWNEPNIVHSFAPVPSVQKYASMLKLSYSAIKSVDPYSVVITGGLAPALDDGTNISPAVFIQSLYAAGAGNYFDGVGIHPYSVPNLLSEGVDWWTPKNTIAMITYLMNVNGGGAKRLWTTEFGAATSPDHPPYGVTEARQSEILVDGINYLRSLPNAGPIFVFDYRDINTGSGNTEENYGLIRSNYTPKPALSAVQGLIP